MKAVKQNVIAFMIKLLLVLALILGSVLSYGLKKLTPGAATTTMA